MSLAVLRRPNAARTVDGWGRMFGYSDRHGIEAVFRKHGLQRPWRALAWLRLLCAVDWVYLQGGACPVQAVAERFKFSDGKYLNTHCRKLTRMSFPDLADLGPERALDLMAGEFQERLDQEMGDMDQASGE